MKKANLIKINSEYTNLILLLNEFKALLKETYPKIKPINEWEDICLMDQCYDTENNAGRNNHIDEMCGFYTRDKATQDLYCNDDAATLRLKLLLLSLGTCTINLIALILCSVNRFMKLITLDEFKNSGNNRLKNLENWSIDMAIFALGPLILLAMQITAMFGTINPMQHGPRDARKMYALGETMLFGYNGWRLAPCFKPNPDEHLFGGKVGKLNQW